MIKCPNCGNRNPETNKFCGECGTDLSEAVIVCPSCGIINKKGTKYCDKCGFNLFEENITNSYEKHPPAFGRLSRKIEKKLDNSKLLDKLIDKSTPDISKLYENDVKLDKFSRKYLKRVDPEFLEVFDSIDDKYLKSLFMLERNNLAGSGFWNIDLLFRAHHINDLSHEEALIFYRNILNKVKQDLEKEKQKPNFDEREYFKKKLKEQNVEKFANYGIERRYRSFK